MSLVSFLERLLNANSKQNTARIAKERLQIIVSHERKKNSPDFLPMLQQELIDVIAKYVKIDKDQVKVELERTGDCSVLELNVTLPSQTPTPVMEDL
ncbi:MAG: cell division topological specificity factor MinE [Gammaproteobacteria bacterium]|nr:cell division topological specificity factor MinE [Gammaproteobacteria bacterium]